MKTTYDNQNSFYLQNKYLDVSEILKKSAYGIKSKMNKAKDLADDLKGKNWESAPEDKKAKGKWTDGKRKDSFTQERPRVLDLME